VTKVQMTILAEYFLHVLWQLQPNHKSVLTQSQCLHFYSVQTYSIYLRHFPLSFSHLQSCFLCLWP